MVKLDRIRGSHLTVFAVGVASNGRADGDESGEALRRREHRILVRRRINLDAQREGVGKARVLVGGRVGRRVRVAAPFKGGPQGAQSPVTIADNTKERSSKQNQSQYAAMRGWWRWRRERRWRR